jgi:CheY-like chemotaxis protein/DNA-directed RNA polymerase specialized sigma24 family protein
MDFVADSERAAAIVRRLTDIFGGRRRSCPPGGSSNGTDPISAERYVPAGCLSDDDLVHLLGEGQDETLAELGDRYGRIAYGLAVEILHEPAVAEEIVESTLHAIWDDCRRATPLEAAATVFAAVHRSSVQRLMSKAGREGPHAQGEEQGRPPPDGGAWTGLEHQGLRETLAKLPTEERDLLVLAYYAGLTADDLSENGLAISGGSPTTKMETGLRRLVGALDGAVEGHRLGESLRRSPRRTVALSGVTRASSVPPVIIVCDPDPVHRELIRASLSGDPCDVFELNETGQLLSSVEALEPDLLIVDPHAPGGAGIDDLRALRLHPAAVRMPVLVLTTGVARRQREAAFAAGATRFLAKPFSPRVLASTVAQLVATRHDDIPARRRAEHRRPTQSARVPAG